MPELFAHVLEQGSPMGSQMLTVPDDTYVMLSPPQGSLAVIVSCRGRPVLYSNCGCVPVRPYGGHLLKKNDQLELHGESMFWSMFMAQKLGQTGHLFATFYGTKPLVPSFP